MDICEYFVENFQNLSSKTDPWMQRMSSSFSNFNKKLNFGNSYDFGDFDSCLSIKIENSKAVGKYCLVKYTSDDVIPVPPYQNPYNSDWTSPAKSFGGAVCIPNVCNNDIIKNISDILFDGRNIRLSTDYNQDEFCQIKEAGIKFGYYVCIIWFFMVLYLAFILLSSWKTRSKKHNSESYLSAFSFTKNFHDLFEVRTSSFNSTFQFMSILRAFFYIAVIFFHSYFNRAHYPSENSGKILEFMETFNSRFLVSLPKGLMGFFIISSALTTKKVLTLLEKNSFNFCTMLVERYCRTMFIVLFMIILNIFINNMHIFQAPFYYPDFQSAGCKKNWWMTMLLITNFHTGDGNFFCLPQSWFLCANFHFFILTPFIIYPIWKWRRSIWLIFPLLLIGSLAINYSYSFLNKEHLEHLNFFSISDGHYTVYYVNTIFLATPWIIGMILGFVFHRYKKIYLNKPVKTMISSYIVLMTLKLFIRDMVMDPPIFNIIFFTLDRLSFSLYCASAFFLANYWNFSTEKDRVNQNVKRVSIHPLNTILIMIDRVGLSLYLINVPVIMMNVTLRKQALVFDVPCIYLETFSDILISIIAAVFMFVLVEEPFSKISRKILNNIASKAAASAKIDGKAACPMI